MVGAGQIVSGAVLGLGSGGDIDFADQTVTANYTLGVLTLVSGAAKVGTLQVEDAAGSEGFTTKTDGQGGTDIVATPSGTATGDVHLVTFDGLHYAFQADGDFTLARSTQTGNPFDVEIRTMPWTLNHLASLTTQAAAQVGAHVIDFILGGTVKIDGAVDTVLSAAHPEQRLDGGTLTALGSGGYQLDWTGGERLTVSNEGFYLNLQTTLAATDGPGSVQGLLGALRGQANDLSLPDGTVLKQPVPDTTLLGEFADAWRVSPAASLLDGTATLRPDTLGMPTSPSFLLADAPGELLTGSLGSTAGEGVIIGGSLANLAGAVIANFAARDFIDVTNLAGASAAFQETSSADGGQLTITDGFHSATLTLMGTGASAAVQYSSDHHGGTLLGIS
jgi:von Willebrand factor type D domain